MNKNIILFLVVLVLLGGGWYYMNMNKPTEESVNTTTAPLENQKILNIVTAESKATYEINEELRGKPTLVVGNSQSLSGTVTLNTLSQSIEGANIILDANSFKTDIAMRDDNVRGLVLRTNEPGNENIVFKVTAVTGLPAEVPVDTDFPVVVSGDMTIAGVTKAVNFDGMLRLSADGTLRVQAMTVLTYGDFGVTVPDLPFLANVEKTVKLSVDIVAR